MPVACAVCHAPCRGRCAKCGAHLCAQHKPVSTRAKCAICKRLGTSLVQTVQAIPPYPSSPSVPQQPVSVASGSTYTPPLALLDLTEQMMWIADRRARLQQKQARERAYLDRRAARGTHTPTDDAYEADQLLEHDLFEALDLLETCLQGGAPLSGPTSTHGVTPGNTSFLFADPDHKHKIQP